MKTIVLVLFFVFFALSTGLYATGTVNLITYYPAPTAAYNKVSLPTINSPCDGTAATKGILFLTATGSLNVCDKNGNAQVYPQQCFNTFCSYPLISSTCPGNCVPTCSNGGNPPCCTSGFQEIAHDNGFPTDPNNCVMSFVCCGGN